MKEIYYWMMYFVKKSPSKDMYEFNSYLFVSLLFYTNLGSIIIIVSKVFNINQGEIFKNIGGEVVIVSLVYLTIMYLFLFLNRKEIQNKYDQLLEKRRKRVLLLFWMYMLLIILCWVIAYLCIGE
jgi:Na+/H+ antiporter NhaD/arsenite permease-like protein